MDFSKLTSLMPLFAKLDPEALQLFIRFGKAALDSGDPAAYVKRAMRKVLDQPPTVVDGEFIE